MIEKHVDTLLRQTLTLVHSQAQEGYDVQEKDEEDGGSRRKIRQ